MKPGYIFYSLMFLLNCCSAIVFAQGSKVVSSGAVTVSSGHIINATGLATFTTAQQDENLDVLIAHMPKVKLKDLFSIAVDRTGGIKGTVQSGGSITLNVYGLDMNSDQFGYTKSVKRGKLIYYSKITKNSPNAFTSDAKSYPLTEGTKLVVNANNMQALLQQQIKFNGNQGAIATKPNLLAAGIAGLQANSNLKTSLYNHVFEKGFWDELPVIIEIIIDRANLDMVKIPGIGEFDMAAYLRLDAKGRSKRDLDVPAEATVEVYVNNDTKPRAIFTKLNVDAKVLDLRLGDRIKVLVKEKDGASYLKSNNPSIVGVASTWIARFSNDLQYYLSPSITPGEYKPWIGFDTRVHFLMMRRYPKNWKLKEDDWVAENGGKSFSWTAQTITDISLSEKYTPEYKWPKYNEAKDKQRHSQKEGLNMEILNSWKANTTDFISYNGTKYQLGGDPDELTYLQSQTHVVESTPEKPVLRVKHEEWKNVPAMEGLPEFNGLRGYPSKGFPVNDMVTAYRQQKNALNGFGKVDYYRGVEIMDKGTNNANPDGNGTGAVKGPGMIIIDVNGEEIKFRVEVKAPLTNIAAKGFYGSIKGTKWPSSYENNVPYTLTGLNGLKAADYGKYALVYSRQDEQGDVIDSVMKLNANGFNAAKGEFTAIIKNTGIAPYASVTAYYYPDPVKRPGDSVMIGGKELKLINLRFCGITGKMKYSTYYEKDFADDIQEGTGFGMAIFAEDFRTKKYGRFVEASSRSDGRTLYRSRYNRTYVVEVGGTYGFQSYDADPHNFPNKLLKDGTNETEWYLSAKSEANKVTYGALDGSSPETNMPDNDPFLKKRYLQYYLTPSSQNEATSSSIGNQLRPVTENCSLNEMKYKFNTPGEYDLEVRYRGATKVRHKIIVVEYNNNSYWQLGKNNEAVGKVKFRPLSENEKRWLSLTNEQADKLIVSEVADIYSGYKYLIGARSNNGQYPNGNKYEDNRWAFFKDYNDQYRWWQRDPSTDESKELVHAESSWVSNFLYRYKDELYKQWFPTTPWTLHFSSTWKEGPPYVANKFVTKLEGESELTNPAVMNVLDPIFNAKTTSNWQHLMPFISFTDFHGYRMRYNPKAFFNLQAIFDTKHGAFSGNPYLSELPENSAPDISDEFKDLQEFYYNLDNNRILITEKPAKEMEYLAFNTKTPAMAENVFNGSNYIAKAVYDAPKQEIVKGADVSWITEMLSEVKDPAKARKPWEFYDQLGQKKDLYTILNGLGIDAIRFRVWVNETGLNNYNDVINKIKNAKKSGIKRFLIDFHYSDYFADPEHQSKPKAWLGLSVAQLETEIAKHTTKVLTEIKNQTGVVPEWVQVGNEINDGMLWPEGFEPWQFNSYKYAGQDKAKKKEESLEKTNAADPLNGSIKKQPLNLVKFIKAGSKAVRDFDSKIKIILHVTEVNDDPVAEFDRVFSTILNEPNKNDNNKLSSSEYDIIGQSIYPTPYNWKTVNDRAIKNLTALAKKYDKQFMFCEAGNWESDPQITQEFINDLIVQMKYGSNSRGLGVFYWEPQSSTPVVIDDAKYQYPNLQPYQVAWSKINRWPAYEAERSEIDLKEERGPGDPPLKLHDGYGKGAFVPFGPVYTIEDKNKGLPFIPKATPSAALQAFATGRPPLDTLKIINDNYDGYPASAKVAVKTTGATEKYNFMPKDVIKLVWNPVKKKYLTMSGLEVKYVDLNDGVSGNDIWVNDGTNIYYKSFKESATWTLVLGHHIGVPAQFNSITDGNGWHRTEDDKGPLDIECFSQNGVGYFVIKKTGTKGDLLVPEKPFRKLTLSLNDEAWPYPQSAKIRIYSTNISNKEKSDVAIFENGSKINFYWDYIRKKFLTEIGEVLTGVDLNDEKSDGNTITFNADSIYYVPYEDSKRLNLIEKIAHENLETQFHKVIDEGGLHRSEGLLTAFTMEASGANNTMTIEVRQKSYAKDFEKDPKFEEPFTRIRIVNKNYFKGAFSDDIEALTFGSPLRSRFFDFFNNSFLELKWDTKSKRYVYPSGIYGITVDMLSFEGEYWKNVFVLTNKTISFHLERNISKVDLVDIENQRVLTSKYSVPSILKNVKALITTEVVNNVLYIYIEPDVATPKDKTIAAVDQQKAISKQLLSSTMAPSEITVYPNPAKEYVNIDVPEKYVGGVLVLSSLTGKIYRGKIDHTALKLNTTKLIPGLYFVKVSTPSGESEVRKVIIVN